MCNSLRNAFIELDHDIINGELHTVPIKSNWFTKYDYPSVLRNLKTALAGSCVLVTYIEGLDVYVACTGDRLDDLM